MTSRKPTDEVDARIIEILRANAREPAASIAATVHLTEGAVRRRIQALEDRGVITRFTIAIDHDKLASSVEAFVGLAYPGSVDIDAVVAETMKRTEVREAIAIAGKFDLILRVRASSLTHLRELVRDFRQAGPAISSETMVILGRRWHAAPDTVVPDPDIEE